MEKGRVAPARKRDKKPKYDKKRRLLEKHGCWFGLEIYLEYRKIITPNATDPIQASRVDGENNPFFSTAIWFRKKTYFEYKKISIFQNHDIYELVKEAIENYFPTLKSLSKYGYIYEHINEAMDAYLPELKKDINRNCWMPDRRS